MNLVRRAGAIAWLLLLCTIAIDAAFVEVTGCSSSANSAAVSCSMNTTANQIVYVGSESNGGTGLTVSSTGTGDVWHSIRSDCANSTQVVHDWWMIPTNSTTGDLITMTPGGGTGTFAIISGATYSGAATSSPLDTNISPCGTGSGAGASGNFTATSGDLITCFGLQGGGGVGAGAGFTMNWSSTFGGEEFQTLSGTTANCVMAGSGTYATIGVAIKIAGGGATVTPKLTLIGVGP